MNWRLICETCTAKLDEEIKSVGILKNPDLSCACCGIRIRASDDDRSGEWSPVSEDQLMRARQKNESEPDDKLHYGFALDDDEGDLGAAQDEICRRQKIVPCKLFKCDEVDLGVYVIQIYMNDHTPNPVYAGAMWRHDCWPSDPEIMWALHLWRGPGAPEFIVEWYADSPPEKET